MRVAAQSIAVVLIAALASGCSSSFSRTGAVPGVAQPGLHRASGSYPITHVIVVMQENRSFDNLFHGFPGANTVNYGKAHGKRYKLHQDHLKFLFDLRHDHPQFLEDFDQGKLDGFDSEIGSFKTGPGCSDPINHPSCWRIYQTEQFKHMAYAYVAQSEVQPYWTIAQDYALGDNTFGSNNGPSFPSHQYMIAAQSGHASEVPQGQPWGCNAQPSVWVYVLDYGQANPPVFSKATGHEVPGPYPCFSYPTMATLLDAAGISWRYYSAPAGNSGYNLDAFMAIQQVYKGPDWPNIVHPDTQILDDITNGQLPQVSWVTPTGSKSDHGGKDSGDGGPDWVASIVNAVGQSQYWNSTAIFVLWDEWGGWYDHVKPHQYPDPVTGAYEGLDFRVPVLAVSPYVKAGYISHSQHEIASTLHFIENVFVPGQTLGLADARADAFDDMFNFSQKPLKFRVIPSKRDAHYFLTHTDNTPGDSY